MTDLHNITTLHLPPSGTTMSNALTYRWTLANKGQSGIKSSKTSYRCNHHGSWLMWVVWQNYGEKIRILQEEYFKLMNKQISLKNKWLLPPLLRASLLVVGKRLKKEGSTAPSDFSRWSWAQRHRVYRTTATLWENGMTMRSESQGSGSFTFCMQWDTAEDSQGTQYHQVLSKYSS